VEQFIDTPVKRYSSGMYVRLAFAVAAHLEPEILIIDEVLAVGDTAFQKKCLGKMDAVAKGGRTVLFVSHNMQAVNALCTSGILISSGRSSPSGNVHDLVRAYLEINGGPNSTEASFPDNDPQLNLNSIRVTQNGISASGFTTTKPIDIELVVTANGIASSDLICGFTIMDQELGPVFSTYFNEFGDALPREQITKRLRLICTIPPNFLNEGRFDALVDVGIAKVRRVTNDEQHRFSIEVSNPDGLGSRFGLGRGWRRGPILPLLPWKTYEDR
jgi:lipopolysaccharide transport system ATP-binding protein